MTDTVEQAVYRMRVEGQDQLDKLKTSLDGLAVTEEKVDKGTRTTTESLQNRLARLDPVIRAQEQYRKALEAQARYEQEGVGTADQRAAHLQLITQRYNEQTGAIAQTTVAQKAFAAATSGVSGQLIALSAGAGPVGVFLSALGPWGIAGAAGIGLVTAAFSHMKDEAARVGEKAIELRRFSEITGLNTEQIRGLNKAGAELGIGSEQIDAAVSRFTVGLEEAHKATGDLYEKIREIDPALAEQLSKTRTTAEGWDLYAKAIKSANDAGDIAQRNALARAGGGRGGVQIAPVAVATANAGGLDQIASKYREISGVTNEWTERVAKLKVQNDELEKQIANMKANAYAADVLEAQNRFLQVQKEITAEFLRTGKAGAGARQAITAGMPGFGSELDLSPPPPPKPAPSDNFSSRFNAVNEMSAPDTAGWDQLDKAIAGATQSQKQYQDALARSVNQEKTRQGALGSTVDQLDQLKLKQNELELAFATGKIQQPDFSKANDQLQQQITYVEQLKQKWAATNAEVAKQLESLSQQTALVQARTGSERLSLQYNQTIANLIGQGKAPAEAAAVAAAQMALAQAQINAGARETLASLRDQAASAQAVTGIQQIEAEGQATFNGLLRQGVDAGLAMSVAQQKVSNAIDAATASAEKQLQSLKQQYEVLKATDEVEKSRIQAKQTYNNLVDSGASGSSAQAVASQQLVNSQAVQDAQDVADADRQAAQAAQQKAQADQQAAVASEREAQAAAAQAAAYEKAYQAQKYLPFQVGSNSDVKTYQTADGTLSQFNPAGYQTMGTGAAIWSIWADAKYGKGNWHFDALGQNGNQGANVVPNEGQDAWLKKQDDATAAAAATAIQGYTSSAYTKSGGNAAATANNIIGTFGNLQQSEVQTQLSNIVNLLDDKDPQKQSVLQAEITKLQTEPVSIARDTLIKNLNDQLKQLTDATNANTQAKLDPLMSQGHQYLDQLKIGYYANADGGILGPGGRIPLMSVNRYADGDIADSPQMAMFGEAGPEAFIPLKGGAVPVTVKSSANDNAKSITQNITQNIMVSNDVDRRTARQIAQHFIQSATRAVA